MATTVNEGQRVSHGRVTARGLGVLLQQAVKGPGNGDDAGDRAQVRGD